MEVLIVMITVIIPKSGIIILEKFFFENIHFQLQNISEAQKVGSRNWYLKIFFEWFILKARFEKHQCKTKSRLKFFWKLKKRPFNMSDTQHLKAQNIEFLWDWLWVKSLNEKNWNIIKHGHILPQFKNPLVKVLCNYPQNLSDCDYIKHRCTGVGR